VSTVNHKIAIGAIWSLVTRLTIKLLGFISTMILARILFPEDFGLIALTMTMVALFEIFTSFSFDINIIQKGNVTDNTLNSAWTCKVISGLILTVLLFVFSGLLADFFNDERLNLLIGVIALLPLVKGFENIGFVLFRKELDLKKEFTLEVTAKVTSFVVTISSAFILRSYWALVIGMFTNSLVRVVLSYTMHSYRPRMSLIEARELFGFSKWLLLNNLLIFFNHKVTDLVIGRQMDASELGHYSLAYEVSNLPTTELVFPLSRAVFPGYAKLKNDLEALKNSFLKFTSLIVYVASPICFGMAATSEELISVLLGDKWAAVVPMIPLLAFYGLLRCAVQNTGSIYLVLNKPQIPVVFSVARLVLLTPMLIFIVPEYGGYGASIAILAVTGFIMPFAFIVVGKFLLLKAAEVLSIFAFPISASLSMYILMLRVNPILSQNELDHDWQLLLIKTTLGTILYLIFSFLYVKIFPKDNIVKDVVSKIKEVIRN
jgi:lipopolysaccharide exporter